MCILPYSGKLSLTSRLSVLYIVAEVIDMDDTLQFFLDLAAEMCRKQLPRNEKYAQLREKCQNLWGQLRRRYPPETRRAMLDHVNLENEIRGMETDYCFLLGLQLGITLGRLDLLKEA